MSVSFSRTASTKETSTNGDARTLILHFGTSTQRLKFYPFGSRDDLFAGVREVLGLKVASPLRFRDADGDISLISPSGMQSGIELHVEVAEGIPFQGTYAQPPRINSATGERPRSAMAKGSAWSPRWERFKGDYAQILDNGLTFQERDSISSADDWSVYMPVLPSKGRFYFTIHVDTQHHCAAMGVIQSELQSVVTDYTWSYHADEEGVQMKAAYPYLFRLRSEQCARW